MRLAFWLIVQETYFARNESSDRANNAAISSTVCVSRMKAGENAITLFAGSARTRSPCSRAMRASLAPARALGLKLRR